MSLDASEYVHLASEVSATNRLYNEAQKRVAVMGRAATRYFARHTLPQRNAMTTAFSFLKRDSVHSHQRADDLAQAIAALRAAILLHEGRAHLGATTSAPIPRFDSSPEGESNG